MQGGLKVLMIGFDRNLFDESSAVSARIKEYATLVEELHIIVLSNNSHKLERKKLSENIWLYPTNSFFSLLRPIDAARIGKRIIFEKKFVRGKSVITADSFDSGWAGMKIKKKWRIPLELQIHTDPFSSFYSGFQNFVRKFYAKKILKNADLIRVVGMRVANKLREEYSLPNNKISILPIFVDKEKIESSPISFDLHGRFGWSFIMLSVSRLTPEKNIEFALRTLQLLKTQYSDVGLVVVGDGPLHKTLINLAKDLDVDKNVVFVGWQNQLASYYKTSNVFIQTSLYEGYGLSLIEAGLSNLPIISTPVGVAVEFENGKDLYVCPQGDLTYFASAVADLIENNNKRENLRLNMRHSLENKLLSKENYLKQLKDNWEKVALQIS